MTLPPYREVKAQIALPDKLVPVFQGEAMFRGAYGGRGSGKTRGFATMAAAYGLRLAQAGISGLIVCGREFMNSLAESSFAEVKFAIEENPVLAAGYDCGKNFIRTKCGRIEFAFVGLRINIEALKSKARIRLLWVDEAEAVSEYAWSITIPTIREEGAEIWVTWNPDQKRSATHKRFRVNPPEGSKIVELNWRDNQRFPSTLERTRLDDLKNRPEQYEWIWEGNFRTIVEGSYYAAQIAQARLEGRIGFVPRDPLAAIKVFFDIGGTGIRSDAGAMWVAQFVGLKINVLDYCEAVGQPLSYYAEWLRERKYNKGSTIYLPHDGAHGEKVFATSYESAMREAGAGGEWDVLVVPNQGTGAAMSRVQTMRRVFPRIHINEATCGAGLDALAFYHEKRSNDERNVGLGPSHDWASHGADAGGLMCVVYDEPAGKPPPRQRYSGQSHRSGGGSWQTR
jgi:phage terminase large subunit